MKFYTYHDGTEAHYFKRKDEALKEARANTMKGQECDVEAIEIGKLNGDKALALLNQQQFVESREVVKTVKGSWELEL